MAWLSPWTCVGAGTLGAWDIGLSCSWSSEVPAKYYPTQRGTAALVWVYSCGAAQLYPSRSCGFTQCCARRRRHRERCQVFSGPNRFFPNRYQSQFDMSIPCSNGPLSRQYDFNFITAFLHISGCSRAQTAFSPTDIKVNLTCVCRVQMAPSRVKMTSFLSLLFGIYWAASPAQTAFSPTDIKVNLTCVFRGQMAPPRVRMTSFLSLLFCIYWAASPAQTAFSPRNINGFSLDI